MKFSKWFDPNNNTHIQAYNYLRKTGAWPAWFIKPPDVQLEASWNALIAFKMADAWVNYKLNSKED